MDLVVSVSFLGAGLGLLLGKHLFYKQHEGATVQII